MRVRRFLWQATLQRICFEHKSQTGTYSMSIMLPEQKKIMILAVHPAGIHFAKTLVSEGFDAGAITLVLDEQRIPENHNERPSGINVVEGRCNDSSMILKVAREYGANVCCVFAWYAILKREFIDIFNGAIFNMHFGDLPLYRGAGGFSWQVLNGHQVLGSFVHQLTSKVDAGPVVCSVLERIDKDEPYPADFIQLSNRLALCVISDFVKVILRKNNLDVIDQSETKAEYFPKLTTAENGRINFEWGVEEFSCFVRAFSDPYPGASFVYSDNVYRARAVQILQSALKLHPFCAGLIVNKSELGLHVALKDGIVALRELYDDMGQRIDFDVFRIGNRLWNPANELEKALLYRP